VADALNRSKLPESDEDMRLFFRYLVIASLLSFGFGFAQVVTIRVVNPKNSKPLQGRQISVSLLYEKGETVPERYDANLSLVTDADGEVRFALPNPAPRHMSAHVSLPDIWGCCGVLATTEEVIRVGIVAPEGTVESGRKSALPTKAVPGEVLFLARPPSFWERLFYPLEKG
jgi:hypothetical protein